MTQSPTVPKRMPVRSVHVIFRARYKFCRRRAFLYVSQGPRPNHVPFFNPNDIKRRMSNGVPDFFVHLHGIKGNPQLPEHPKHERRGGDSVGRRHFGMREGGCFMPHFHQRSISLETAPVFVQIADKKHSCHVGLRSSDTCPRGK